MPRKKRAPRRKQNTPHEIAANSARFNFRIWVTQGGGAAAVAKMTGISCYTIWHILNGQRGMGRQTAKALVAFDPSLKIGDLMMVEPEHDR